MQHAIICNPKQLDQEMQLEEKSQSFGALEFFALSSLSSLSFVPEAVITGAAGNFGAVCARMMAAEGAKLALVDLVEDRKLVEK